MVVQMVERWVVRKVSCSAEPLVEHWVASTAELTVDLSAERSDLQMVETMAALMVVMTVDSLVGCSAVRWVDRMAELTAEC